MLEFFRKYQRFFLLMITAVIIISFSFFGTFTTLTGEPKAKDWTVGQAIDGSDLKFLEIQKLVRFLASDASDFGRGSTPNFMNDGVIRQDFLASGLAEQLALSYFEPLKEDLQIRMAHAQRFRPYAHPEAPGFSAQAVWDHFHPALSRELAALREEKELMPAIFTHLAQLYLQQEQLPAEFLRRLLIYQMQQNPGLAPDPEIQYADLSLFGYHSLQDWFGPQFLDLAAQFVWNGALAAEEKGFRVTAAEAKGDLIRNFEQSMQILKKQKKEPISFQQQLRLLGLEEKEAIESWQKVLLFRRYFRSLGESALLDSLPYRELSSFAGETAVVQVYSLPEELQLKTAEDWFGLQFYLDTVAVTEKDPLAMPTAHRSLDEIEKKAPELVETLYKAQVSRVGKREIALRASVKEVVQWQLDHWDLLAKQFPELAKLPAARDDRFAGLEKAANRAAIDAWSRLKLVDAHPEWIDEALAAAEKKEKTISLSTTRVNLDFIQEVSQFGPLLQSAADGHAEAEKALSAYSADGSIVYRLEKIDRISERQVRPLADLKREGILQELVNRHLEQNYAKVRAKSPQLFQTEGGDWKPFSTVKEAVGLALYADAVKAIDVKEKTSKQSVPYYVNHRMAEPMRRAALEIQETKAEPKGFGPYKLVRQEKQLHRTAEENWMNQEAFILLPNQWSPIHVPDDGQIVFFYVQERKVEPEPIFEQLEMGKETISRDAKRYLSERLIDRIQKKKAITIPMQKEGNHV